MKAVLRTRSADALFAGGGELPSLCRAIDWRATPIGDVARWPSSLRAAVRICLDATGIPMAIWAGPDLTLIYNQSYAAVLGPSRHPRALAHPAPEICPELCAQLAPHLRRLMEHGECTHREGALFDLERGSAGGGTVVKYSLTPVRGNRGEVVAALNVIHGTTRRERRRLIKQALRTRDTAAAPPGPEAGDDAAVVELGVLAKNITGHTRAAHGIGRGDERFRTLADNLARLRDADRHKTEFLAWLSHELRNPLGIMRTSFALIQGAGLDSEAGQRALAVINRQVAYMGRLLDDLLDIARISKGKVLLKPRTVTLNEIVRATAEDHRHVFELEDRSFDVRIAPEPLHAYVDSTRIEQIVRNLLQNATKFTAKGGRVALSLRAGRNNVAVIEVQDDGAGIPPGLIARIFDPLMQDNRTLHRSRGGLGLGLALVKGLVELHGGTVSATSDGPGRGAVFTIRLPLEPATAS
jgi:signal transduction histidine kinase